MTRSSDSLRVLHVAEAFGGGLFEITRTQAEGLATRGHDVAIAYGVRPETPANPARVIDHRVELFPMPWTQRSLRAQVEASRALRHLVSVWRPDVVHLQSSIAGFIGAATLAGRVPTVYTPQGYAFTMSSEPRVKQAAYRLVETYVGRRVDLIGASSVTEAEQARRLAHAPRVKAVENGIDELDAPVTRASPPQGRARVIAVGRPSPQRRPEACARILARVTDLADVAWVGGGREGPGQRALREANVPLTGWVPRTTVLQELDRTAIYLHWTAWDGLPLSILEALARDVVVVASRIGPNHEVLGDEQTREDEDGAVALVRTLLTSPDAYEAMLRRQRLRRLHYSADRMVERWIGVYRHLMKDELRP